MFQRRMDWSMGTQRLAHRRAGLMIGASSMALLLGCSEANGPAPPVIPMGSIQVTISTTGTDLDPDGYALSVTGDNVNREAGLNSTVTIEGLGFGGYAVSLDEVSPNCTVDGGTAIGVTIDAANVSAEVEFHVDCSQVSQLAYRHVESDGNSEIYLIKSNGSGALRLTNHPAWDGDPAWSPDGASLAFTTDRDGHPEIYVMNGDGSNPVRLTTGLTDNYRPAWSPDGTRIAFVSTRDANDELYVMNADGTNPVRLTNHAQRDADPAWSPDGTMIAFTSERADGNPRIHVMQADGSGVRRVSSSSSSLYEVQPDWSPDGARIAFSTSVSILVMNADGSGAKYFGADGTDPAWSADGRRIAFSGVLLDYYYEPIGSSGLYLVSADETNLAELLLGESSDPAWRP